MQVRLGLVSAAACLVACYHPAAQTGLPCSEPGHTCPGDQVCDQNQVPPVCVDDAAGDGGVEADAPPPIPCAEGCPSAQPVCDTQTSTCRPCVADSDCPGACFEMMGTCTTEAETLFVAPGGSDVGNCSRMAPCASPGYAVQNATMGRRHVRVEDGTYTTGLQLRADAVISGPDVDPGGVVFEPMGGGGSQSGLSIDPGLTIVLEGLTVANSSNDGVVNRGTLTVSHVLIASSNRNGIDNRGNTITVLDSRIDGNQNAGINGGGALLEVERSVIVNNRSTGVNATNGFSIINTVIAGNGANGPTYGGVHLGGDGMGGATVFRFNTLVGNKSAPGGTAGVHCDEMLMVEDSILDDVLNTFNLEVNTQCVTRYSLFRSNLPSGAGNVMGDPMLVDAASDFHLQPGSPAIDKADQMATDTTDFENGVRPTGSARDIGADERP